MAKPKLAIVEQEETIITIAPPNLKLLRYTLTGTAPLGIQAFSAKAKAIMREKHIAGSKAKKGSKRTARDFKEDYEQAFYRDSNGRPGVNATAFRCALIDVCRLKGFKMTLAKLSLFIVADDYDVESGYPIVHIHGNPEPWERMVTNATGVADIRVGPRWTKWSINLNVEFDADQFSASDVTNLLATVGKQCGIGEGRPYGKHGVGLGMGTFNVSARA